MPQPITLVTGANGFVAAHIVSQLIALNHLVIGSVRSPAHEDAILALHPEWKKNLSFVVVEDYAAEGAWDEVFQQHAFDFVIHTAAPLLDGPGNVDFDRDFLRPSVQGDQQLLQSAKKYGRSLKSIAVTGSINAITDGSDIATRKINSNEWLPLTIEDARQAQHPYYSYCVAKAEAEKAIWEFVKVEKPEFTVEVLLPALIFGPPIHPIKSLAKINFSTDQLVGLWDGRQEEVPETPFPSYIDVRDLATAHIIALQHPAAANQRFIVGGKHYSHQVALDVFKNIEGIRERLVKEKSWPEKTITFEGVDAWNEKLGLKLRSEEETFADTANKVLQLEESFAQVKRLS